MHVYSFVAVGSPLTYFTGDLKLFLTHLASNYGLPTSQYVNSKLTRLQLACMRFALMPLEQYCKQELSHSREAMLSFPFQRVLLLFLRRLAEILLSMANKIAILNSTTIFLVPSGRIMESGVSYLNGGAIDITPVEGLCHCRNESCPGWRFLAPAQRAVQLHQTRVC